MDEPIDPKVMEMHRNLALKRAYDLNKQLYPGKATYIQESDTFFVTSSRKVLRVGTDCSGIEAPIQALQNLRVKFEHSFSCEIDESARK